MAFYNENMTHVTQFLLAGLPFLQDHPFLLFSLFLTIYITILTGNAVLVFAVKTYHKLHTPMYFFLSYLAILDMLLTTTVFPKLLAIFLLNSHEISFTACFIQLCMLHSLGFAEGLLLLIMAFDRYVAVCTPLRYTAIMTDRVNIEMVAGSFVIAFVIIVPPIMPATQLPFCGPNKINHCFCDHLYVIRLACADISLHVSLGFSIAMAATFIPCALVIFSYIKIICAVLKIGSTQGRQKAFSTCSSHLMVVIIYYISIAITYIAYKVENVSDEFHAICSIFFTVITPVLNPLIYAIRNKDVKDGIAKFLTEK
ncbi:olfactory receptor 2AT4-like [Protopterus annectens]|uniref:olfactory receptor 2AT4-like n=1 Tax=Protopterus annectens TaxID=7888 RepID=UPI001CFA01DB|nr:olfactory receptor 2AT4-like [Protopterus annectens]